MFWFKGEGRMGLNRRRGARILLSVSGLGGASIVSATAGASSKVTDITMWNDNTYSAAGYTGAPGSAFTLQKAVAQFEKANPNIKVSIPKEPFISSTAFNTLLQSSEIAGTTPDIGELYVGGQVIQSSKFLVPLNKVLGSSYIKSLSGWQFVTDGFKNGGTIYGVPYGAGYYFTVYYNKADFVKEG